MRRLIVISYTQGLATAIDLTQILSARFDAHDERLSMAAGKAATILETLDETSEIAANVRGSISRSRGIFTWWPYVVCPVFSLVLGSYRLPPSGIRNLGLVVLGKFSQCTTPFPESEKWC